ncbi:MAG: hypothetical protein J6I40_08050 [Mailhella sp.]|nr:hypothetical protein [Mailhella sp.]
MRYRFIDGYEFEADTAEEICAAIWKSMKFAFHSSLQEWMDANASVMSEGLGERLRTDTPEHHVEDMIKAGIIRGI